MADAPLEQKLTRYVTLGWIAPMAVVLPLSLLWFLFAASSAGVPVRELIGAADRSIGSMLGAIVSGAATGHPIAQQAVRAAFAASLLVVVLSAIVLARGSRFARPIAAGLMACAFVALGAGEWVREDLRKPYAIGSYMLVNGVRLQALRLGPEGGPRAGQAADDRFTVGALNESGVLPATLWRRCLAISTSWRRLSGSPPRVASCSASSARNATRSTGALPSGRWCGAVRPARSTSR